MIRPTDSTQQHSPVRRAVKTAAKVAVGTGIAAGTVLLLAKKGKLDAVADGNKYVEGTKVFLKKYADPANDFIGRKTADFTKAANEFIAQSPKLTKAKTQILETVRNFKEIDFVKHFAMAKETIEGFIKEIPAKAQKFVSDVKAAAIKLDDEVIQ